MFKPISKNEKVDLIKRIESNHSFFIDIFHQLRERYLELLKDKSYLESVYAMGAAKAERQARKTLRKVYKKVGFYAK